MFFVDLKNMSIYTMPTKVILLCKKIQYNKKKKTPPNDNLKKKKTLKLDSISGSWKLIHQISVLCRGSG